MLALWLELSAGIVLYGGEVVALLTVTRSPRGAIKRRPISELTATLQGPVLPGA